MTDERTKKVARNEAMYREVNERIEDLNDAFSEMSGQFAVVAHRLEDVERGIRADASKLNSVHPQARASGC